MVDARVVIGPDGLEPAANTLSLHMFLVLRRVQAGAAEGRPGARAASAPCRPRASHTPGSRARAGGAQCIIQVNHVEQGSSRTFVCVAEVGIFRNFPGDHQVSQPSDSTIKALLKSPRARPREGDI